jgi:hypothetical protein
LRKVTGPGVSHCGERKATLEKGFDNRRIMRRPSSVNLRRLESSRGKGWWVLGWSSCQMSFMKGSSRMERELPQMESPGKLWVKVLGSNLAKVSLGVERGFKILPDNGAKMLSQGM